MRMKNEIFTFQPGWMLIIKIMQSEGINLLSCYVLYLESSLATNSDSVLNKLDLKMD